MIVRAWCLRGSLEKELSVERTFAHNAGRAKVNAVGRLKVGCQSRSNACGIGRARRLSGLCSWLLSLRGDMLDRDEAECAE
jgi:hypothetical protein